MDPIKTVFAETRAAPKSPSEAAFVQGEGSLVDWLTVHALPIWSTVGVDQAGGGFFEKIDLKGVPVEEPRRARVVARQIYVFAVAARRGWLAGADALVEHGLSFLHQKMRLPQGTVAAAVHPDGAVLRGDFDLYEHAFVLFAWAAAHRDRTDRAHLQADAQALLARMRGGWGHPVAGFEEASPRTLPLKSNPHMHLLEAALAWAEISGSGSDAAAIWRALADEIVDLCLSRFIDRCGALHEYFDGDWAPMPGPEGRVVEPGHQFEWAWLLWRWATGAEAPAALRACRAAQRLLEIGEAQGVDRERGVAINALDQDFAVVDGGAKLWPQTERIKAWHAAAAAGHDEQRESAPAALADAVRGLARYFLDSPRGLWHEQLGPDGRFAVEDCRASSLYHIVCAIDALQDAPQGIASV